MLKDEDAEKRHRALQKIKKCFSLAKSSNAHEAEAAIRQAHKMPTWIKTTLMCPLASLSAAS